MKKRRTAATPPERRQQRRRWESMAWRRFREERSNLKAWEGETGEGLWVGVGVFARWFGIWRFGIVGGAGDRGGVVGVFVRFGRWFGI